MKQSVIIAAFALGFSFTTLNAHNSFANSSALEFVNPKSVVSPFCMSIVKGDIETVKKLVDLGVDVNEKSNGMTPAMYAAKFNRVEVLKLLVEKGADLNLKSEQGMKAKKYAELSNAQEVLTYLEELKS